MNYSICLEYNSINFGSSGGTPTSPNFSSNGFSIYTDIDNFTVPIAVGIPSTSLFPPPNGNCPFIVVGVPSGSTQLLVIDDCSSYTSIPNIFTTSSVAAGTLQTNCCYALIPIVDCENFCSSFGVGLANYSTSSVAELVAGNLTGSNGIIADFVMGWYKDGNYNSPALTTGNGTLFSYDFPHPLNVPVTTGNYEGIIHDISINNTIYSSVSGSAGGIDLDFSSCFSSQSISSQKSSNANNTGLGSGSYSNYQNFTLTGSKNTKNPPTSFTFDLSGSKYFAYAFKGGEDFSELEIKYINGTPNSSSNDIYKNPIYLEKIRIGANAPGPYLDTTVSYGTDERINNQWPKNSNYNGNFQRVLTLTSLDSSSNPSTNPDKLEITVTPNSSSTNTSWELWMQEKDSFDCTDCFFPTSSGSLPRQISKIELLRTPSSSNACLQQKLKITITGCNETTDFVSDVSPDLLSGSYVPVFTNKLYSDYSNHLPSGVKNYFQLAYIESCGQNTGADNFNCIHTPTSGSSITHIKANSTNLAGATWSPGFSQTGQPLGRIQIGFGGNMGFTNYMQYKTSLDAAEAWLNSNVGPLETSCHDPNYYCGYVLSFPSQSQDNVCGATSEQKTYYIHRTALNDISYNENPTTGIYTITIPMPDIDDCLTFPSCSSCNSSPHQYNDPSSDTGIIDLFRSSSYFLPNQIDITNGYGARYWSPFGAIALTTTSSNPPSAYTSSNNTFVQGTGTYGGTTTPFISNSGSSTGWMNLSELQAEVCPDAVTSSLKTTDVSDTFFGPQKLGYLFEWSFEFTNVTSSGDPSLNNNFKLYSKVSANTGSLTTKKLIYSYSGSSASIHEPSYFVGGSPTIVIEDW